MISVLLGLLSALLLITRPDSLAALTVYPTWLWAIPGLGLAATAFRIKRPRPFLCVAALWILHLACFSEEPRSLLRFGAWPTSEWQAARSLNRALRIVSINCAGGNKKALAEVAAFHPDIVLVQETPSYQEVATVAKALFGDEAEIWVNFDAAIIARGRVRSVKMSPPRGFFAQAQVELRSGITVNVFSVHTMTPPFRVDLWNPEAWRAFTANRKTQREQFGVLTRQMQQIPPQEVVLCGGDFNAMQGDPVAATMAPRLRDAFAEAGRGWGNTISNDMPALRIDQVWISAQLQATTVFARKTLESDHRMVIADLIAR